MTMIDYDSRNATARFLRNALLGAFFQAHYFARWAVWAVFAVFWTSLLSCQWAAAAPLIDQFYETPSFGNTIVAARFEGAQTFTVGLSGILTGVEVNIGR